jgi:hypothetical protein
MKLRDDILSVVAQPSLSTHSAATPRNRRVIVTTAD